MQTKDLKEIKKEFHQIMMDWIEKQWELEKAHQNGEPYTRMKFEAESAKIEDKMESLLDHAIQSAIENERKELKLKAKSIGTPDGYVNIKKLEEALKNRRF